MKILFVGTREDEPYLQMLKPILAGHHVKLFMAAISTFAEISHFCKKNEISHIISTSQVLLEKVSFIKKPSISNYAGSLFKKDGLEILFVDPLKQLITVSYGKFILERYVSKFLTPEKWNIIPASEFSFTFLTPENIQDVFSRFQDAIAIAVDIETIKEPLSIESIGYTAIFSDFTTESVYLPIDSMYAVTWMRKFNWELQAPKILQNGKYDISYLASYDAPLYNYLWDTASMFYCWYSELPKDLAYLSAFFIRDSIYWKDMASSEDAYERAKYNARDTWSTANVFIQWMFQAPDWAKKNYLMNFPLTFPCHLSEMIGIKRDMPRLLLAKAEQEAEITKETSSLQRMIATPNFNPASPKQCKQLLTILGCGDLESSDEKHLNKAAFRHPLNSAIVQKILDIRGRRKLTSTYLTTGADAKEFKGRILYALTPWATDTGRLASKEHHFWCGLNIQNQPRGKEVKQTYVADDGFLFGEVDLEQAESRDTAYISGDLFLIDAVESPKDFHSINLCAFFGRVYEDVYDDGKKKTKDKVLRDLAKRINHGANYNMGPNVLVDTMGLKEIYKAASILGLPKSWEPKQIAEYLLGLFHKTYPGLKGTYYPAVISSVISSKKLVGATGWTRYCFGNPQKNKSDLNAYTAHCPQSLNAMTLNKAYMKVFYDIALNPKYANNFKLCAQIHDSILFQFREGHEYLCDMVKERMEIPVKITACTGKNYEFMVPAAIKAGKDGKGAKYWSETE